MGCYVVTLKSSVCNGVDFFVHFIGLTTATNAETLQLRLLPVDLMLPLSPVVPQGNKVGHALTVGEALVTSMVARVSQQ